MDVSIVLRQSPDWGKLTYDYLGTLGPFEAMAGLPAGFIKRFITTWDEVCQTPYFEVRERLKALSLENLESVQDSRMITLDEWRQGPPEADVYLFVDDDDWFSPKIGFSLAPHVYNHETVIWTPVRFCGDIEIHNEVRCFTNNYGVFRAYFRNTGEPNLHIFEQHFRANHHLVRQRGAGYIYLEETLSVGNKHPASPALYFLYYGDEVSSANIRRHINEFLERFGSGCSIPDQLAWAEPYTHRTAEIFDSAL